MRKSKLPLKKLYTFVSHFLKRVDPNKQAKKRGRPQKYEDALIITLWLFQILNNYSYRETLEKAKDEGFNVPSLCDYHYRVGRLDDELLNSILEECAKLLLEDKQSLCYIADATGFGFGDKYNLNWKRGTQIRTVQSHVRLEAIIAVDENKRKIITAVETGGPYESEVEMLRNALKRLKPQKGLPFIADKGYDAVDIIESLLDRGFEPAIRIKETMRMSIRHPLRKLSNENWKRYGKMRYRVEQLFGSIKQKIGSSFKLLRKDLARKASLACAILWNFWVLATYLFLLFLSGILHYSYAKGSGRFLEQPKGVLLSFPNTCKRAPASVLDIFQGMGPFLKAPVHLFYTPQGSAYPFPFGGSRPKNQSIQTGSLPKAPPDPSSLGPLPLF